MASSYAPIEPEPLLPGATGPRDPLLDDIARLGFFRRVLVAIPLLSVGLILAFGALALGTLKHWSVLLIVLLVVEPLALFMIFGALYCLAPHGAVGRAFDFALRRAKPALLALLGGFAAMTFGGLLWTVWLYFRLH